MITRYQKGDMFPNLNVKTIAHTDRKVREILKGTTVFWVLRYIGCPICRLDVRLIANKYHEFEKRNAQVFVVMQSDREHVKKALKNIELPFEIICDEKKEFYDTLMILPAASIGLLAVDMTEELKKKGDMAETYGFSHGDYEGDELQLPALFIVDDAGRILYVHYARELADMPDIDQVLELLDQKIN